MFLFVRSKTQDFLEIAEIIADMIITKNGTFLVAIKTNAVNFELLSVEEQESKIRAFGSFINSLDFDLQILIDTKHIRLHKYADYIDSLENKRLSPGMQRQFKIYKRFIRKLVASQNILDKKFYLVIPYRGLVNYSPDMPDAKKKTLIEQALNFLIPKRNHVLRMLKQMGLEGQQMTTADLVKYFYKAYNAEDDVIKFESQQIPL